MPLCRYCTVCRCDLYMYMYMYKDFATGGQGSKETASEFFPFLPILQINNKNRQLSMFILPRWLPCTVYVTLHQRVCSIFPMITSYLGTAAPQFKAWHCTLQVTQQPSCFYQSKSLPPLPELLFSKRLKITAIKLLMKMKPPV